MDLRELSIVSYNCKGIKNSYKDVQNLCDISDTVFLQETWLTQQNLVFLQTISSAHYSYGFSPVNESEGIRKGRPYGGTAILSKKDLQTERVVNHIGEIIGLKLVK